MRLMDKGARMVNEGTRVMEDGTRIIEDGTRIIEDETLSWRNASNRSIERQRTGTFQRSPAFGGSEM